VVAGTGRAVGTRGRAGTLASLMAAALTVSMVASVVRAQDNDAIASIWDGHYTNAQAERGKAAFGRSCSRCHGSNLRGSDRGPPLVGEGFLDGWLNGTLEALFSFVRDSMPEGNASTVDDARKADILAYILDNNGFPAGAAELTPVVAELERVQILREGVEPGLLNLSFVQVVGCLERGSGTAGADARWVLTRSNARPGSRGSAISSDDLERARTRALGEVSYTLVSEAQFEPASRAGHRVAAKGLLYSQPGDQRLNLTALETLADTCTAG
jgi:mono/diheme cytochrome c family protein